jgi:hypothetical protein
VIQIAGNVRVVDWVGGVAMLHTAVTRSAPFEAIFVFYLLRYEGPFLVRSVFTRPEKSLFID